MNTRVRAVNITEQKHLKHVSELLLSSRQWTDQSRMWWDSRCLFLQAIWICSHSPTRLLKQHQITFTGSKYSLFLKLFGATVFLNSSIFYFRHWTINAHETWNMKHEMDPVNEAVSAGWKRSSVFQRSWQRPWADRELSSPTAGHLSVIVMSSHPPQSDATRPQNLLSPEHTAALSCVRWKVTDVRETWRKLWSLIHICDRGSLSEICSLTAGLSHVVLYLRVKRPFYFSVWAAVRSNLSVCMCPHWMRALQMDHSCLLSAY